MNSLNHAVSRVFDLFLAPLDSIGRPFALVLASAVFGVIAIVLFKHVSAQRRIKAAKNKIKGHLIEIRIYQDDLAIVGKAIGKVLARNLQYLALNLAPFVPLSIPFVIVLAQLVVRYGYAPAEVHGPEQAILPGRGSMVEVELSPERAADIAGLRIELPEGVRALSPLVRVPSEGRAFQEVAAIAPGARAIRFVLPGGERAEKEFSAGFWSGPLQPERGTGFFSALLWPAEDSFSQDSPFRRIRVEYPEERLAWFPSGPAGVLIVFLIVSMAAGLLAMKPLKVQI
ncbi:MAG: hypothetical protein ACKVXR_06910 [Planctomycetota bacterium]